MGTDIHSAFQAKKDGRWTDIPHNYEGNRHYFLFSWLAGVRNGFGFAGVKTYEPIEPLSAPRGLPPDIENDEYFGDHNFSWLTADEILTGKRPGPIARTGVIGLEQFKAWDGKTPLESWSGSISGPGIVVSPADAITPETTHVQIEWTDPDDGLDYFVNEVRRLRDEHGDVRFVFGFDS